MKGVKVYNTEREEQVFARRMKTISLAEARGIADRLFEHFDVAPVAIILKPRKRECGADDARTYAYYSTPSKKDPLGRIRLLRPVPDWIIAHEVAHYVAWCKWCGGEWGCEPSHNQVWAEVYVEAVGVVIGEGYAERLARALG
jgi:hypothetical protein